jgi:hypothetical protein
MEGRIWKVKGRECLDTVAKYMLKYKTAFDIPKVSNEEREVVVSTRYKVPARLNPGGNCTSMDVDGDGTCLFHAFLFATVGLIRTLPNSDRSRIGRMFRTLLYQENKDHAKFKFEGRRAFNDTEEYVEDDALMFLIGKFKVNVCLIEGGTDVGEYRLYIFNAAAPHIVLYNKSRIHFTPVKVGDRYLLDTSLRDLEPVLRNTRIPYVVFTSPGHSEAPFIVPEIGNSPLRGLSDEILDLSGGSRTIRRKTRNKR